MPHTIKSPGSIKQQGRSLYTTMNNTLNTTNGGGYRPSFMQRKPLDAEDKCKPGEVEPPSQMCLEDLRERFLDCKRGGKPRYRRSEPALND